LRRWYADEITVVLQKRPWQDVLNPWITYSARPIMFQHCAPLLQRLSLLLGCCILSACATATASNAASSPNTTAPLIQRVIVQLKSPSTDPASRIAQLAQQYQLGMEYEREMGRNFYIATLKPAKTAADLQPYLEQIAQDPDIANIEADLMMHTMPAQ
jgi:hypothetical protein